MLFEATVEALKLTSEAVDSGDALENHPVRDPILNVRMN